MRIRVNDHCRVPDYGAGVVRGRLLEKLDAFGRRPTVITGSAGAGKSVLAVQYARHVEANVLWLDAGDVPLSARAVWDLIVLQDPQRVGRGAVVDHDLSPEDAIALVVGAIRGEDLGAGVCVVIDNAGTAVDSDGFRSFQRLVATLHTQGIRLLITTRSLDAWPTSARCDWCVVDEHDLCLRGEEAIGLAGLLRVDLSESDIAEVLGTAAGHVSLCVALSLQAARHGMKSQVRVASLEAWLERVLSALTDEERRLVEYATALKTGTERELLELGIRRPARLIRRVTARLPLFQAATDGSTEFRFWVHDLVDGYFAERGLSTEATDEALGLLQSRGDYTRCCELLVRSEDAAACVRWLSEYGETALDGGHVLALDRLFARVAAPQLMSTASVVALWSRVCGQTGRHEESLAKARAAKLIAEHERDTASMRATVVQTLLSLQALSRYSMAYDLAEKVAAAKDEYVDSYLLAEALACMGACRASWGQLRQAEDLFEAVLKVCDDEHRVTPTAIHARSFIALTPALALGEFEKSRRMLLALTESQMLMPSTRIVLNGNLAVCMAMCGRLDRAEALARGVVSEAELCGLRLYVGAYLPVLAFCRFSRGDAVTGLEYMRRGIETSLEASDISHAAVDRLWMCQMLRAVGRSEESLAEAESAYGVLSRQDELGFQRLAAHEVAAALLACGDSRAARGRIASCGDLAECENLLHRTAAVLTLAECDRLDGRVDRSLARLEPLSEYLCSESPNLLVAFYARAFPNLLGLVALTVGVENLPIHMLRLIPPESAEIILGETRAWLDDAVWHALGLRLLGEDEFNRFMSRDGLPVCHVRFFGALEVTIGGRSIREKDWRKRKARLLFAMLVSRRGHDVPREQIFEHLFADMDPERAKNNLYVSWSTMKSVLLGEGARGAELPYLETIGGVCRAVSANIRSDIDDFDKLLASASHHEAVGEYPAALLDYEALSSLYRGELLPGDVYDDWFAELREHYRITFVDAMLSACSLLMDADDPGNALVFVRRAIQTDPLREDLYQAALRCQIAAGQRSGAIDTYVQCRSKLADDLGLDPSVETKALYDQILAMEDRPRIIPLDPFVD